MALNHHERNAAERRISEIKQEIKTILEGVPSTEGEIGKWQALLEESMTLQMKLEDDSA